MLFTDPTFLFVFLPVLLALYFLAAAWTTRSLRSGTGNASGANWMLLVGCLIFYANGGGTFTWLIVAAIVFSYATARTIDRDLERRAREPSAPISARPEVLLAAAVTGNVMLLGIFKTANPLNDDMRPLLTALGERSLAVPALLAPLGLSFFACHAISYLVDVYRRDAVPHRNPVQAALYLLLIVMVGWVLFRTETLASAILFIQALTGLHAPIPELPLLPLTPAVWIALAAGVLASRSPASEGLPNFIFGRVLRFSRIAGTTCRMLRGARSC